MDHPPRQKMVAVTVERCGEVEVWSGGERHWWRFDGKIKLHVYQVLEVC